MDKHPGIKYILQDIEYEPSAREFFENSNKEATLYDEIAKGDRIVREREWRRRVME